MKSVFNKIEKEKPKGIRFPVLAEYIENGAVVLFISYSRGIVLHGDDNTFSARYYEDYISVDDETHWRILSSEESIVLSND